jgi:hypothetical protein
MRNRTTTLPARLVVLALSFCSLAAQAQTKQGVASASSALPDVAGIRPGMPAQEAYAILKARNPNIRISMGQAPIPGFGDKPVVTEMRAQVTDASAPETITLWLTIPPTKQVVFAVGRLLEYDHDQPLLRSNVLQSLREKYGPETDLGTTAVYWGFDQQGRRPDTAHLRQLNCAATGPANLIIAAPPGATFPAATPLIYPLQPDNGCNAFIKVTAELMGEGGVHETYVRRIAVMVWDLRLYRQTQEAYRAYLADAAKTEGETEVEKAKQRKVPKF